MKRYTAEELAEVLRLHSMWLRNELGGVRANLSKADLSKADLIGVDLRSADLSSADLSGICLSRAKLNRADLSKADLSWADLGGADLSKAFLNGARLCAATLRGADLSGAYLSRADLRDATLRSANLSGVDFSGTYLSRTDFSEANIAGTILPTFQIVPETGSFDGWKKLSGGHIAHLRIPAGAGRVSSTGRKCRAEYVKVVAIYTADGKKVPRLTKVGGYRDIRFIYSTGEMIRPDKWDPDIREECTHGIHFFLTRKEAEEY